MEEGYPYIKTLGKLKEFFERIPHMGVPPKVTENYIESIGYRSKNHRPIVKILKFIKFIDEKGKPTENWIQYRNKENSKGVMARCIKEAYDELFGIYPDAYNEDDEKLKDFLLQKNPVLANRS